MGADVTVNPLRENVTATISNATEGEGVDVVLEMSGAEPAINDAFTLLKPGGEVALLGLTSAPITFDLDRHVIFKGAKVHGIAGRKLWDTWFRMRGLLRSQTIDLSPVVTHRFALDDYDAAFDLMASGDCGKVVMFPDPGDADGPLL
jgi:threonine 3-dehydrogenase